MRWLIYGAGNIGCLYAARLAAASEDVTLLARGTRAKLIRERGIELEDSTSGERTTTSVRVVERLESDDAYDLVLVSLPKHQISEALPVLAANRHTPSVMFFGNNAAGPDEFVNALGSERVLLGFPGAAATRAGGLLRYHITTPHEQSTTFGELDGSNSTRIVRAAAALEAAGFPSSICSNMEAWLQTHVAESLPTVCALLMAGGTPMRLASADDALRLMLRSIHDGYRVLRANGVPITPANHRIFERLPESLLLLLMRRMVQSETTAIEVGHAEGGRAEWLLLADEFRTLIDRAEVATPSLDTLLGHLFEDGPRRPRLRASTSPPAPRAHARA